MTRASVRRAFALAPDKRALAARFTELAVAGPLPAGEVGELLAGYLFDPIGSALLATTPARAEWLAGPLFRAVGPGNFAPHADAIAALIVGPLLAKSEHYVAQRWAPRADDAVAFAVAALPDSARAAALERLASDPGPEPALLAQSLLQCGRALACSPDLLDAPIAGKLVGELVALLHPSRPKPLLDAAARVLGSIASRDHALGKRARDAAFAALDAGHRAAPASFAAEIAAIGRSRRLPDEDRMLALPGREVAQAAAYALGVAAPLDRQAFAAHRRLVLDRPDGAELADSFAEGLVAAAHVPALAALAAALLDQDGDAPLAALGIAAALPLDPLAARLIAALDDERPSLRALACDAVALLDHADVDGALAARLGDPSPDVSAAAARALLERGRREVVAAHAERETHPMRAAVARAATGDLSVAVIGELANGMTRELEDAPIAALVADCLLGSPAGLETAANFIGGVPEAAGLIALAASAGIERDVGVLAPPEPRAHLANVVLRIADPELSALGLFLLARVSAGDVVIADVVADALATATDYAENLVAALAELRVATPNSSNALAALVAPDQPIGARVLAAAACGRALAAGHAGWQHVRELLELGTIARAAAWTAVRDRARRDSVTQPRRT